MMRTNKFFSPTGKLKWLSTLVVFFTSLFISYSQEVLLEMGSNPSLTAKHASLKNSKNRFSKLDTINIDTKPFFDDFSSNDIYPNSSLWLDSNVFINRDYPIAPPTIGAATFDGVSKTGCPYDTMVTSTNSLPADTLTSKPINLTFLPSDSIYLSFYWQPEGRGNQPDNGDSLVLQFKNASDTNPATAWKNVWGINGFKNPISDTTFHLVMIPIKDTVYLKNGFQFRFRNYATISGNVDHWHIDYVLLDKNRNKADTTFSDVSFIYNSPSLLKNYYAMPWKQYLAAEMKSNINFLIRNNDTVDKNTSFVDTIYNGSGTVLSNYNGGNYNVTPYKNLGIFNQPGFNSHSTSYSFPALTTDTSFLLKCILNTTPDKNRRNDTLIYIQNFKNYFAYDDGTAEAGYGLTCDAPCPPSQLAYKFTLNQPDTLVAVQMLFNWIGPNVNQQQFQIRVWSDNNGLPGTMVYEDTITTPNYEYVYNKNGGNLTNTFYPYILKSKIKLSGIFYVGFVQYTIPSSTLLNLGFDRNTNSNSKMFYKTDNFWEQATIPGSWMIRPVFGTLKGIVSISEENFLSANVQLYPNPTDGRFTIQLSGVANSQLKNEKLTLFIYSTTGQLLYETQILSEVSEISLNQFPKGLYFVRINSTKGLSWNQKLLLTH